MAYINRQGALIGLNAVALLFAAVFYFLAAYSGMGPVYRVPITGAFAIYGLLNIVNYLTSRKASVLFDHSSLLSGILMSLLAIMSLIYWRPADRAFFMLFSLFFIVAGFSHIEDALILKEVKGVLWFVVLVFGIVLMGTGVLMIIQGGHVEDDTARIILATALVIAAGAELAMILMFRNRRNDLHEAMLKIADGVKEAIKKEEEKKPEEKKDEKTIINLMGGLTEEDVEKLSKGASASTGSSISFTLHKNAEEPKKEEKKEKAAETKATTDNGKRFPDDLI